MVLFDRRIGGFFRYLKVFLASDAEMAQLVPNLKPFEVLRAFFSSVIVSKGIQPVFQIQGKTTFVDLSKGQEAIYAGMHTNCRYKVRRAEKMHDRFEIVMNTEAAREDFFGLYNTFANSKGKLPLLKRYRFNEYLPHADVFMLYFEGQPTCGRLVLRDEESHTALMLYSATRRFDEGADTITVGLLNRYLHWHEMKTYQAVNMIKYDFGGAGDANPSVTHFKLSFGGQLDTFNYCLYAGTGRPAWRLAHSLYTRWTGEASNLNRNASLAKESDQATATGLSHQDREHHADTEVRETCAEVVHE